MHGPLMSCRSSYLAAAYSSMTTMSTVGWGDITPTTDIERVYTMFAMLTGGVYYGVAMGTLVSMVESSDLRKNTFHDRMDMVFCTDPKVFPAFQ